jgi:hypothetical protein
MRIIHLSAGVSKVDDPPYAKQPNGTPDKLTLHAAQ